MAALNAPKPSAAMRQVVIEGYLPMAYSLAGSYSHWSLDRADLNQTAVLAVIEAVDGYRPTLGRLCTHVWNRVRYALGQSIKKARRQTRSSGYLDPETADPSSHVCDLEAEDHRELWKAIDQLPAKDREILISSFGLAGERPLKREAVATKHGSNRTDVTRSKNRSVQIIRQALSA